ncbi:MAG: hypothetical protein E7254_03825 [Lachnospiraceae bacterium]|nr:hypothetical protein [Lachnospiraceae bacterium]
MKEFIFDKIEDSNISFEFVEHARTCKKCYEELEVVYSMHRALGDITGPDGKDDTSDYVLELNEMFDYYDGLKSEKIKNKRIRISVIIVFIFIVVISVLCFIIETFS